MMDLSEPDIDELRRAYQTAREALLAERLPEGHWLGKLSPSALSTATAVGALGMVSRERFDALIGRGLAPILNLGDTVGPGVLLVASAAASSVTDNIPLAAMLAKILGGLDLSADSPYWWAVIFGANLGGNITPIGSASTLVAVTIIHKSEIKLSFADFVRLAVPYAAVQLVIAVGYLLIAL